MRMCGKLRINEENIEEFLLEAEQIAIDEEYGGSEDEFNEECYLDVDTVVSQNGDTFTNYTIKQIQDIYNLKGKSYFDNNCKIMKELIGIQDCDNLPCCVCYKLTNIILNIKTKNTNW